MVRIAILLTIAFIGLAPGADKLGSFGPAEPIGSVLTAAGFLPSSADTLPSSFIYGGESSTKLLPNWPREDKPPQIESDRTIYETTWREPGDGLVATWRCIAYHQWPAMEFRWIFHSGSNVATKPLTRVEALDLSVTSHQESFELLHSTGGLDGGKFDSDQLAFALSDTLLGTATLSAGEGRSSNKDLPFFIVHGTRPDVGLFIGIGWSGQWQAVIDGSHASTLHMTAEMPGMHLALPPGEEIISPSILLGSYRGPSTNGSNLLRTILYSKYTPLLDGKKPLPPVSWNSWFLFENRICEQTMEAQADVAAKAGIEYFCVDSGWFDVGFPNGVGNWTVDATKFPHRLKEIGDYVKARNMKLGLWFEPERAAAGTRLAREHPEWLHGDLVDLGNPAVRDWLFQMMKAYIEEAHIRWICWDFNTNPLAAWNAADAHGQNGLTQIREIMGLYALLDRVMAAYPDLFMQGCASGGRRIDLETIKRSHTFWKSDFTTDVSIQQFHEIGGNTFLPGQLLDTHLAPENLPYDSDSILGGPFGLRCDMTKLDPKMLAGVRDAIALATRLSPLINEDFYALFPQRRDATNWTGFQFNSPSRNQGFIVLLRPEASPVASNLVVLHGLDPAATYTVETIHGPAIAKKITGALLMQGQGVSLPPHASAVYLYTKTK